jgi:hypothetical protein
LRTALVTTSNGVLVGTVNREDVEQSVHQSHQGHSQT